MNISVSGTGTVRVSKSEHSDSMTSVAYTDATCLTLQISTDSQPDAARIYLMVDPLGSAMLWIARPDGMEDTVIRFADLSVAKEDDTSAAAVHKALAPLSRRQRAELEEWFRRYGDGKPPLREV